MCIKKLFFIILTLSIFLNILHAQKTLKSVKAIKTSTPVVDGIFFDDEWNRCLRLNMPITLAIIDIDYFKSLNDTYGHQAGDECLKIIAALLKRFSKRPSDICARYGGDEFAIILPEVRPGQAVEIARRINGRLQKTDFHHVTLSFGVAELGPEMDSRTLFENADKAMYMAKEKTKDKIHIYGE